MNNIKLSEILILLAIVSFLQYLSATFFPGALLVDLALIAVTYIGWNSNPVRGAVIGFLFGLSQDFVLLAPYLGLNGTTKTLIGFASSYLSRYVLLEGRAARFLILAVFSALDRLAVLGILWILTSWTPGWSGWTLSMGGLLTGLGGALFFNFCDKLRVPRKDFRKS